MESDDFLDALFFNKKEKDVEKFEESKKGVNVYYYKGGNGIKYQISLREYFKMTKIYGQRLDIAKNLVWQKELFSFFPAEQEDSLKSDIFLCSSPDSFVTISYNPTQDCVRLYQMFPKFTMLFEAKTSNRHRTLCVGLSEINKVFVYFIYRDLNIAFFNLNISLSFDNSDFFASDRTILSISEDTTAVYTSTGALCFIRCCREEPEYDNWSNRLQVLRFTDDVYSKNDEENIKYVCTASHLNELNQNKKFLVKHFKGETISGNNLFIVYFTPKIGGIIHNALKNRYTSAGKIIKKVDIHDWKIEVLSHSKTEAMLAVHCIFNASEYPTRYYTVISLCIPFFTLDYSKYKTRLENCIGVKDHLKIDDLLKNHPELQLNKHHGLPYSTFKFYDHHAVIESINSIEPIHGGIEYTLEKPDIKRIEKFPILDLKQLFR
uniref:Uncharacterized protein n=1 Tax=Panagrolaimus superbus TaxID=310955 RepID=A0A914Z997_9BILA